LRCDPLDGRISCFGRRGTCGNDGPGVAHRRGGLAPEPRPV